MGTMISSGVRYVIGLALLPIVLLTFAARPVFAQEEGPAQEILEEPAEPEALNEPAEPEASDEPPELEALDEPTESEQPALITGIELRKEAGELRIHFRLSSPAHFELVGNPRKRVLVAKFFNVRAGLPDGKSQFAYNDPLLAGIAFETVHDDEIWAKIRLRIPNIDFQMLSEPPAGVMTVGLRETVPTAEIELLSVRLVRREGGTRMVLDLNQLPRYEMDQAEGFYFIRLLGVAPAPGLRAEGEDERVVVVSAEIDGRDTILRVRSKLPSTVSRAALTDPARLVFDFAAPAVAAAQQPALPAVPDIEEGQPPGPASESLEELLAEEQNPRVRATYILAEREFRSANYQQAATMFRRVYEAAPQRRLGLRAFLRAADAEYEQFVEGGARNFHAVIVDYQAALRAAETAEYESELIPRAIFQIGRSYQYMGFNFEANVHFEILQQGFPDNLPYTADSFFYRGETYLETNRLDDAMASFRHFLEVEGEPALEGPALYKIGDALYNQEKYAEARREFDQARRIAPAYANDFPLLLFHIGETYYENAEFGNARVIYQTLLDRYPTKIYTKLVAIRLGDFLVEEGKEEDALKVYRRVAATAPLRIRLRAKLRIANLLANRPAGDDFQKALDLYGEIAEEAETSAIIQEAMLRTALTLTLHQRFQPAIDAFEKLKSEFPNSPYLIPNIYDENIDENLKGLIDTLYREGEHWEVAKVYTRYRDDYFPGFRFKVTLFQIASAYHDLGLYPEALALYRELLEAGGHSLIPLIRYRIAQAYTEKDELAQAEEQLLRFIQDYEDNTYLVDVRMELGRIYDHGRRYQDAVNAYQLIVTEFERTESPVLAEATSEAYYRLGEVYKELGEQKNAADAFRNAVRNFHHPIQGAAVPQYIVQSHFLIGDMFFGMGQDDDALRAYQDAIDRYSGHDRTPWAWYQIGLIYRRQGQDDKALETFNTLVDLAKVRPGELWESLAKDNQRELANVLQFNEYLNQ